MELDIKTVLRMRDVGLALSAAGQYEYVLNRIGLQKFLYLADALSRLFEVLPPAIGHETYKHGPYDRSIQNAVDCLCFRRLVRIAKLSAMESGNLTTEYELTDAGVLWASRMASSDLGRPKWAVIFKIAAEINAGGYWRSLRELVYAEPTFVNAKSRGWGHALRLDDAFSPTSFALVNVIQLALNRGFQGTEPSLDLLISLYFKYLQRYSASQR